MGKGVGQEERGDMWNQERERERERAESGLRLVVVVGHSGPRWVTVGHSGPWWATVGHSGSGWAKRRSNDLVANIRCWRQEVLAPAPRSPPGNFGHQRRLSGSWNSRQMTVGKKPRHCRASHNKQRPPCSYLRWAALGEGQMRRRRVGERERTAP